MNKALLIGGIGLAGFGFYRYFKYQVAQALNYDYKIKNLQVDKIEGSLATVSMNIDITNKSNFSIIVRSYDLTFGFKGVQFAHVVSNSSFVVLPQTSFSVHTTGVIDLSKIQMQALSFAQDVLARKPINIEITGNLKVKFMGLNSSITFNQQSFQYSPDLLKDFHLSDAMDKFKQKNPKLAKLLGIK